MQQKSYVTSIIALMLVLFIDGMGQGIIFPIISKTLANNSSTLFLSDNTTLLRHLWFGFIVGGYYLMWFISAPLLGDWSDSIGRKKPLLVCLSLAAISFLVAAFALDMGSLSLLLISRLIGGATSGDQAIAKAAIIDICPEKKKPIYLGLVLCSVTLGLVIGPLLGAYLQNPSIYSNFNSQTPLYFAALISLLNIFLLQIFFKEKVSPRVSQNLRIFKSINSVRDGFKANRIKQLLIIYCLTQLGWQIFYINMQEFFISRFQVSNTQASLALALLGVGIFLGLAVLPHLFKNVSHRIASIIGYSILIISIGIISFEPSIVIIYPIIVIAAAFFGLAAVNMLVMFSKQTDVSQQGWVMGITGSVVALTGGIGALLTGILSSFSIFTPYEFALIVTLTGVILFRKRYTDI